MVISIKE